MNSAPRQRRVDENPDEVVAPTPLELSRLGGIFRSFTGGYIEEHGSTHAELTEGLRKSMRSLSDADLDALFAEV